MARTMPTIEAEYIKNLQQQIYFLELEANFLREQTKKAVNLQPRITSETELMFTKMRELQSQGDGLQLERKRIEAKLNMLQTTRDRIRDQIHETEDAHSKKSQLLVEEIMQLKRKKEISDTQISQKDMEILHAQQELERELTRLNNCEQKNIILQSKLKQRTEQKKAVELQLSERRMDLLKAQSAMHEMEEKIYKHTAEIQDQVTHDLRNEISLLHQQLREKEHLAEQDQLLRSKMMDDCAQMTKENAMLHSRLLELNKQRNIERALKEENYTSHSSSIAQLLAVKDHEDHLQREVNRHQDLLEQEKNNFKECMDKILILEKGGTSADLNVSTTYSRIAEIQAMLSKEEQTNVELRRDKTLLVDLISNLQTQIANKEHELSKTSSGVEQLDKHIDALKSKHELQQSLQSARWQEISGMANSMKKLTKSMADMAVSFDKY
ncbi:interaptin-like [Pleurodeles waltl]|uniref:interaptin-like n=1 Tax=Pleurodeles waltl TaxID=8319 RepID=UPI0037096D5F